MHGHEALSEDDLRLYRHRGYRKITFICERAVLDGLDWAWVGIEGNGRAQD